LVKLASAREPAAVDERLVELDQIVLDGHHVAALERHPRSVRHEPLERARSREGAPRAPADGGPRAVGGHLDDLEREVGEGAEQLLEIVPDAVGRDVLAAAH
jgi:hypothetical protein